MDGSLADTRAQELLLVPRRAGGWRTGLGVAHVDHLRAGEVICPGWRWIRRGWALLLGCALAASGRAHTPDTSYCKVVIGHDEVAITLTYDFATVARMAEIDANRDQRLTRDELTAALPAIEAFLRQGVFLELNQREAPFGALTAPLWPVDAGDALAAADWPQRLAAFTFRNPQLHAPDSVAITFDFFGSVGERHTVLGNFHWNSGENPVVFTRFEPDYLFDTGYQVPAGRQFRQYVQVGMSHIFLGYDHVAFLLALMFVTRFRDLVKVITAFTAAHTLTLALATLEIVSLPARLVESAIAASIIYVAVENLVRATPGLHRWRIAFAFGLVHGFGFASVLRELGLPSEGLVRCLLAFNVGVEAGQLVIAALFWPVLCWIARRPWAKHVRLTVSAVLLAFGTGWLLDRAFQLGWMPF